MRAVVRIVLLIPAAFIAASLAAALVITLSLGGEPGPGEVVAKLLVVSIIASMFVGAFAGIPALIMIVLAEVFGWRSLILHLLVGAGIGFVAFLAGPGGESAAPPGQLQLGAAAGAVAGFVYWLIAGRSAGQYRRGRDAAKSSQA
ncbi:MAG: hypothetical protein ACRED5_09900 [Propylenella sp.]